MKKYSGTVIEGSKKARGLGFPTINIPYNDAGLSGIYIGEVSVNGAVYHAAIFADSKRKLLEAYLLDFSGELYGEVAEFQLFKKVRGHEDFTSDEVLRMKIAEDVEKVRAYFM